MSDHTPQTPDGRKTSWTPERRAGQAALMRARWSDPAYRRATIEASSAGLTRKWAEDHEFRAAVSEGRKQQWTEESRAAASARMAERNQEFWSSFRADPDRQPRQDLRGLFSEHGQMLWERDGDLCQLCLEPIDFSITVGRDPGKASVDHIVPSSWCPPEVDPDHPSNYWLAHYICNVRKSARFSGRPDGTTDVRRETRAA